MLRILLVVFSLTLVAGCSPSGELPEELVVVTRNAPTTWYQGRDGEQGPEVELARSFAAFIERPVRFEVADGVGDVLARIRANKGHIGAAGLTDTRRRREQGLLFGPSYSSVQQQVVCRRGKALPEKIEDLVGKSLEVIANSSYAERLRELKQQSPALVWSETTQLDTEQLLEKVWRKELDCTVADSNILSINRRYYPELLMAFPLSEEQPLAWVVAPEWSHLLDALESWLESIRESGELAVINEKYYGHIELFDYVDMRRFVDRIDERLKKYEKLFRKVAKEHAMDWRLLAAQAYQESHWNPKARSATGVRGMMMLTQPTAKQMGVKNRIDAEQSIRGGARYLLRMQKRLPEAVHEEDRLWFALAAYNVGFGHLQDAMALATRLGRDPHRWVELKEVLPLLSQKKYYRDLKYGYARGSEPVNYVQRIRDYRQVLNRHFKQRASG